MARRCWTCIGVLGLWMIGASAAAWGQEQTPAPTAKSSSGVNDKLVETLTLERLRLEQQFQQTAVKIQSLVKEIRRVQELERQQLGATLAPTHPRMLRLQQAQEKSERAILTLQELVEKMNAAQLQLAVFGGESVPPQDAQKRIELAKQAYQALLQQSAFGNEVEMEALQRQAQAQTQAEVMEERMRKMEEYLLKTNFAAVEKARQQAEMKRAAQVLSALEELAQKQDANSQVQPGGESPTGPPETSQDKPESAPGPRRGPSNPTDPLGLMQNQAPPAMVRPLYRPGPQALSPEQMEQMKELIMRMQQKPAPRGDMRPLGQGSAEQLAKQQLQAQSNTTPSAIDKRLEQVEGRLERIEALLQRLVPESPPKQD